MKKRRTAGYAAGFERTMVVLAAITAAMLQLIDMSIVNVSLREIAGSIGATTTEIAWVVTSYAVSNVIMIPLAGMLSDLFGRKRYFTASILLFTVSSFFCGMADSLTMLVMWRFIQGLGGGALLTSAQAIIVEAYPPEKLSTANAIFGMGVMVGPTLGPTLGGFLTENFSWHWIFLVNIPVGLAAAYLSWTFVHNRVGAQRPERLDWWGIAFLVIGISALQYVLEEGPADDWFNSSLITALSVLSVVGLVAFVYHEWTTAHPAVNIRLLAEGNMTIGAVLNAVLGLVLMGTVFVFPLFVQIGLGWTPMMTGNFLIAGALATGVSMGLVGRWLGRGADPRWIMGAGILLVTGFAVAMTFSAPGSAAKDFFWPFIVRGVGMGMMMGPILTVCLQGMTGSDVAQASGITNMIRQIGGAVGIALLNVFLVNRGVQHNVDLLSGVTIYDTAVQDRLGAITQGMMSHGYSVDQASQMADRLMGLMVTKQYSLVAYNNVFWLVGILTIICLPLILFVRYNRPRPGSQVAMVHE
ncbi:MAG: DHA2 family efflux MFS transporter permease subunit [Flavobacteriales bacterium]|nr:DHA2 family efflux MFS transporter permease subunit [Flavobacteriales bacterium]MCB9193233.1 DHA2 family efflux MFS transporter permease subunit [Flavobacteriales bacterium]